MENKVGFEVVGKTNLKNDASKNSLNPHISLPRKFPHNGRASGLETTNSGYNTVDSVDSAGDAKNQETPSASTPGPMAFCPILENAMQKQYDYAKHSGHRETSGKVQKDSEHKYKGNEINNVCNILDGAAEPLTIKTNSASQKLGHHHKIFQRLSLKLGKGWGVNLSVSKTVVKFFRKECSCNIEKLTAAVVQELGSTSADVKKYASHENMIYNEHKSEFERNDRKNVLENEFEPVINVNREFNQTNYSKDELLTSLLKHCDNVPPVEIAFAFELVLDQIFNFLDFPDLLNCRLVCHKWESIATLFVRQQMSLHFYKWKHSYVMLNGIRLEKLIELPPNNIKNISFRTYPCSEFTFEGRNLNSNILQRFFDVYGSNIKKLTIKLSIRIIDAQEQECKIMDQVKYLLGRQTQNLEYLKFDVRTIVQWKFDPSHNFQSKAPNIEPGEFYSNSSFELNGNLKVFNFGRSTSSKIFEMIICMAPNLEQILIDGNNYTLLKVSLNRLDYLNHLEQSDHQEPLGEKVEYADNLSPRSIYLEIDCAIGIKRDPAEFFRGLQWPQVMPNVCKLQLNTPIDRNDLQYLFPKGLGIEDLFPKLTWVRIVVFENRDNFTMLLNDLKISPALIVRFVDICCIGFRNERISAEDLQPLRAVFPNALVKINKLQTQNSRASREYTASQISKF